MRLGCAFLKRGSEGRAALLIQLWWKRFVDVVNARTSSTYKLINEEGRAGGGGRGGGSSDAGRAPTSGQSPGRGVGAGSEEDAWRVQMMSMMHTLATRVEEHIAVSARGRTALATRLVPRGLSAAPGATPRATRTPSRESQLRDRPLEFRRRKCDGERCPPPRRRRPAQPRPPT